MTKFFKIVEKNPFWVILDHFVVIFVQTRFSVKIPKTIPQGALILCQISQKTNV